MEAYYKLENLIDEPIKRCVILLNLLGYETVWSCCGYDYPNQEEFVKKGHQYNRGYIIFKDPITNGKNCDQTHHKLFIYDLWTSLTRMPSSRWSMVYRSYGNSHTVFDLHYKVDMQTDSWTPGTKHHYELGCNQIMTMENILSYLLNANKHLLDPNKKPITLVDTNKINKENNRLWQVEYGSDWTFSIDDYLILDSNGHYKFKEKELFTKFNTSSEFKIDTQS